MNFNLICRLCREDCSESYMTINSEVSRIPLKTIVSQTLTTISLEIENLPEKVCLKCFKVCNDAYNLQIVASESQKLMLNKLGKQIKNEGEDVVWIMNEVNNVVNLIKSEDDYSKKRIQRDTLENPTLTSTQNQPQRIKLNPRPLSSSLNTSRPNLWFECNFCSKKMKPKSMMVKHLKIHNPQTYPHACDCCIKRFQDENDLLTHKKEKSHKEKIFICDLCGVTGNFKFGMESHMNLDHLAKIEENFECGDCNESFENKRRLLYHMNKSHGENSTNKCEKCEISFKDRKNLNFHHMKVHEKLFIEMERIEENFQCCKCEKSQENLQELTFHLQSHEKDFEKFKCNFCRKVLKNFEDFQSHSNFHALPKVFLCLVCKRKFPDDENFRNHIIGHKKYEYYKIECENCHQKFRSLSDLNNHEKVKHQQETLFICPVCAKSMSSANSLNQHIRYVHISHEEKKYPCKFCDMRFINMTKLRRHEVIHSKERPFVCEICASSFKMIDGLKNHMKRHGSIIKNHVCNQCDHKFSSKDRLDQHMMTHTGLKPHECKYCDRSYACKGDLIKHMAKMHVGDAIYNCDKCSCGFRRIIQLREHQTVHRVVD